MAIQQVYVHIVVRFDKALGLIHCNCMMSSWHK